MDLILLNRQMSKTTPEIEPHLLTSTSHQRKDVSASTRLTGISPYARRFFSSTSFEILRYKTVQHSILPQQNYRMLAFLNDCAFDSEPATFLQHCACYDIVTRKTGLPQPS
ncbi:hypothetical protein TNCV_2487681 [Trichonephila clavipes]|uniref:Uncharacterized protein n=1 Tax=Trichonephila clavipes TaxID=2585209 RepID=A0A8X6W017_TRICX|nr:hypothetical protein TNCV_2487681 [Trichonephila clavipes]